MGVYADAALRRRCPRLWALLSIAVNCVLNKNNNNNLKQSPEIPPKITVWKSPGAVAAGREAMYRGKGWVRSPMPKPDGRVLTAITEQPHPLCSSVVWVEMGRPCK